MVVMFSCTLSHEKLGKLTVKKGRVHSVFFLFFGPPSEDILGMGLDRIDPSVT